MHSAALSCTVQYSVRHTVLNCNVLLPYSFYVLQAQSAFVSLANDLTPFVPVPIESAQVACAVRHWFGGHLRMAGYSRIA